MAHRQTVFALLVLFLACGGRETGEPSDVVTGGGAGSSVAGGTGGSNGTTGTTTGMTGTAGTTGTTTGMGGTNVTVGTTGTGGQGMGGFGAGGSGQGGNDWTSCNATDACVLETVSQCGPGCEPVALSAFTAINSASEAAYRRAHPVAPCVAIGCPPLPPGGTPNVPYYAALCVAGQCQAVDIRTTALTACTADSDCYLRSGTGCCACGNGNLIAVSKKVNVNQILCGGADVGCDCASAPLPPSVVPYCSAGHCAVSNAGFL